MVDKLRVLECFAGVGSQSMALRNIGVNYEVVGIMEIDKHALVGYSAIHKDLIDNIPTVSDDYMYNYLRRKEVGTNFSTGKNELPKKGEKLRQIYLADVKTNNLGDGFEEGSGTQSSLVWECKKIIESKKPKFLMMENVKNIVSKLHKSYFDSWCNWLTSMGYRNYWKIYNGNDFGVAQSRERVIMISIKEEICSRINFTEPNSNGKKQKLTDIVDYSTLEDYLIDIDSLEGFIEIIDNNLLNEIRNKIIDEGILFTNKESKEIIERRNKYLPLYNDLNNSSLIVREATKIGYKVAEVGDSINLSQKNSKTRRGRVGKEEAKTLTTACEQAIVLDGYKIKKLSPLEAWRLQGFSDGDYYKAEKAGIPKMNLYERAGRGIVVPMLEEIFKCLFKEYIVKIN